MQFDSKPWLGSGEINQFLFLEASLRPYNDFFVFSNTTLPAKLPHPRGSYIEVPTSCINSKFTNAFFASNNIDRGCFRGGNH